MLSLRFASVFFTVLSVFTAVTDVMAAPIRPPATAARRVSGGRRPARVASHKPSTQSVCRLQPVRVAPASNVFQAAGSVVLTGSVRGANGLPLPGATVWVAGSRQLITVANESGDFSLTLPSASPVSLTCAYTGAVEETTTLTTPSARQFVFLALATVAAHQ